MPPRGRAWIALIAATVFLLHPIQLPAVLHTVQRMAALSFTFVLLAMAIYLVLRQRVLEQGLHPKTVVDGVTFVGLMTVLGALAKENALLTPWLLLVVELMFFRFQVAGKQESRLARISLLLLITPIVALALYLALWRPDLVAGLYADRDFTLSERLMTQAKVLRAYLYWLLGPGAAGAACITTTSRLPDRCGNREPPSPCSVGS